MSHQRKLIRDAVVALLVSANTAAGARVKPTRVDSFRKGEIPAIAVYTLSEETDPESANTAPIELTRHLKLEVAAWVPHSDQVSADEAMDAIADQIEAAMAADYYLTLATPITSVDHTTGRIVVPGHDLRNGDPVLLQAGSGGVAPSNAPTAECWAIVIDDDTIQLARSLSSALAGNPVTLGDNGTLPLQLRIATVGEQMLEGTVMEVLETDGKSDPLLGLVTLTYGVTYRTSPAAPANLDDFTTVDVKQTPAGAVSDTAPIEDTFTV